MSKITFDCVYLMSEFSWQISEETDCYYNASKPSLTVLASRRLAKFQVDQSILE